MYDIFTCISKQTLNTKPKKAKNKIKIKRASKASKQTHKKWFYKVLNFVQGQNARSRRSCLGIGCSDHSGDEDLKLYVW